MPKKSRATRETIPGLVERREVFENSSGTMRAVQNPKTYTVGQLNREEQDKLRIDFERNGVSYLIYSFETPIAWETKNGWIYKVQQELTQTSQRHFDMLYLME